MRFVAGLLLLGHAFVHLAIWLPPYDPERHAFDAKHSQVLINAGVDERGARRAAVVAALAVAAAFLVAGFATIRGSSWANEVAAGGGFLSILLAALYFHPWLLVLVVVDLAIIVVTI
jgi:hypothetical protein